MICTLFFSGEPINIADNKMIPIVMKIIKLYIFFIYISYSNVTWDSSKPALTKSSVVSGEPASTITCRFGIALTLNASVSIVVTFDEIFSVVKL